MNKSLKIFIAGHKGMVGSSIYQLLKSKGYSNLITRNREQLDLRRQLQVEDFFSKEKPDLVINAAAKVGGIFANKSFPYDFIIENLAIQNNLIDCSHKYNVKKFVFLGSSCIYPKFAPQPLKEEFLLTNSLEATNEFYAVAKIAGIKLCQAISKQFSKEFISLMPSNLYGHNDNFNLKTSHVLPAMIRKFHEAKINKSDVFLWGNGKALREFLYVDDLSDAILFSLENKLNDNIYNIGTGKEITIKHLAYKIQKIIGHKGKIMWVNKMLNGTPRKIMDISKMKKMGWAYSTKLEEGIEKTYKWFLENVHCNKKVRL